MTDAAWVHVHSAEPEVAAVEIPTHGQRPVVDTDVDI